MWKTFLLVGIFSLAVFAGDIQSIKNKVIQLEQDSSTFRVSREFLRDSITDENMIELLSFWIEEDEKKYEYLKSKYRKRYSIIGLDEGIFKKCDNSLVRESFMLNFQGMSFIGSYFRKKEKKRREKCEGKIREILENESNLIPSDKIKKILEQFDLLKNSQREYTLLLKDAIKRADGKRLNRLIALSKKQDFLKSKIKKTREDFISYDVISPYLAVSEAYLLPSFSEFLYMTGQAWKPSKDNIKKAIKLMSRGVYKDILLEANEDVREQFYRVYQELKDKVGSREWEDFKVLQTLLDSSSNAKRTGSDRWWH